jgi:hypothetical protein
LSAPQKSSPFLLTEDLLVRLEEAAKSEPAVGDLVRTYRSAKAHLLECEEMVREELAEFQIA